MIDVHIHLLPGVDDGPAALEDSVRMCRMAAAAGCQALIATPHQRRDWPNQDPLALETRLEEVRKALGGGPALYLGAEVRVDDELLDELARPDRGGLLPLAGSRYLLVEFPSPHVAQEPEACLHELLVEGWNPVVAHPELTPWLGDDLERMQRLVAMGAATQITAMSVCGDFGRRAQRTAFALLEADLVHFLASDAHSPEWRPPGLERAFGEICRRWGDDTARRLTTENPRAVLQGAPLTH